MEIPPALRCPEDLSSLSDENLLALLLRQTTFLENHGRTLDPSIVEVLKKNVVDLFREEESRHRRFEELEKEERPYLHVRSKNWFCCGSCDADDLPL